MAKQCRVQSTYSLQNSINLEADWNVIYKLEGTKNSQQHHALNPPNSSKIGTVLLLDHKNNDRK